MYYQYLYICTPNDIRGGGPGPPWLQPPSFLLQDSRKNGRRRRRPGQGQPGTTGEARLASGAAKTGSREQRTNRRRGKKPTERRRHVILPQAPFSYPQPPPPGPRLFSLSLPPARATATPRAVILTYNVKARHGLPLRLH